MITFVFTTSTLDAKARHGLDMLAMAVSLDQPAQAIFQGQAVQQLAKPTVEQPDPLKKLTILLDIFDFEAFYATQQDLSAAGLEVGTLRVPVQIINEDDARQLCDHQSRFVLRF